MMVSRSKGLGVRVGLMAAAGVMGAWGCGAADAGMIYINSPLVTTSGTSSVAGFKYRMSHTNFDQSLDRGTGTSAGNFISSNLGNNAALTNAAYSFQVENIPGQGLVFRMTNMSTGAASTLSWGTFETPMAGTTAQLINGVAPGASFNSLLLGASATRAGSSFAFSNLAFTSPTMTIADGSFVSDFVDLSKSGGGASAGRYTQQVVSDSDLAAQPWVLGGVLTGTRDAVSGGDETVKFTIFAQNVTATIAPVPTPTTMTLVGVAGALLVAQRRRR